MKGVITQQQWNDVQPGQQRLVDERGDAWDITGEGHHTFGRVLRLRRQVDKHEEDFVMTSIYEGGPHIVEMEEYAIMVEFHGPSVHFVNV